LTEALLRVVVDPNVAVSALITPNGITGQVMRAGLQGHYRMIVCPHLLGELEDVLRRPRLRRWFSEDDATEFVADLSGVADNYTDPSDPPAICRDPDDDYLLALAVNANVDILVSGDDDLLALDEPPIEVISPRAFLDRLDHG
jgi:putative PIN family toxin of toxin-antitoxin system